MRRLFGFGLLLLLLAGVLWSCAGRTKAEVESGLRGLRKNAPLSDFPIERRKARIELEGEPCEIELCWMRLPATRSGGTPLVFVHGTPSTLFDWAELVCGTAGEPALAGESEIYLVEVPGHGTNRSELPRAAFQACADSVRALLESLDLREVTLVGQSYGGEFAWRAALDAPERVRKLVLIDSSGWARPDDAWLPEERKLRNWSVARLGWLLNSRERLRPALELHFRQPLDAERLEELYLCCDNPANWRAMTDLCRDENGTRERELASLRQPTLLVWGERDRAYPVEREGRRFEAAIRGARLCVVPDAGHYPHAEQPAAVRRLLREFHAER